MASFFLPLKQFPILLLALFLAGCYLPSQFKFDVRIADNGAYTVSYVGRLAESTLLIGLRQGTMDAAKEAEKVETVKKDLARDSGFRAVNYVGGGFFDVRYKKAGNIFDDKTLTFVNGSSRILSLALVSETNTLTILGSAVPVNYHKQLESLGFTLDGELRVVTDAKVLDHNANQISGDSEKTYVWILRDLDAPAPKIVIGG